MNNFWKSLQFYRAKIWGFIIERECFFVKHFLRFYLNNDGKFIELSWKILSQKKLRKKAENAAKWTSRYQEGKNEITYWICFFYYLLFLIWDTAGYATTRFPSGGMKHNNKQQSRVKNRQGKHSDSKLMSAWNSCEIFRNILFDFNFIHHRSETHKKMSIAVFQFPIPSSLRPPSCCLRARQKYYLLRELPWCIEIYFKALSPPENCRSIWCQ